MNELNRTYIPRCGDVFLNDSNRVGAKIVKFLQEAPTLWQWLWRQIRGTQDVVRYYHAGMIIDKVDTIEQQWKVQFRETESILSRDIVIYRNNNLTEEDRVKLYARAIADLAKSYDIPQLIGKTLTWLTGIKWFVRFLGALSKEEEICVTRVADWYDGICDFGVQTKHEVTTKVIDEYCFRNPEEWDIVYLNLKE